MRTQTKKQLIERIAGLEISLLAAKRAVSDLALGRVRWFGKGDLRLGICRADEPDGCVVIEQQSGQAGAFLWDDWQAGAHGVCCNPRSTAELQRTMGEARDYVARARAKNGATGSWASKLAGESKK
jgi:hypothetical protein